MLFFLLKNTNDAYVVFSLAVHARNLTGDLNLVESGESLTRCTFLQEPQTSKLGARMHSRFLIQ